MPSTQIITAAAIQMVSSANMDANFKVASELIAKAAKDGASLVVLPENFALFGRDNLQAFGVAEETPDAPIRSFLREQAKANNVWLVGGTAPRVQSADGVQAPAPRTYAACQVINPNGKEVGRYDKIHLFDAGVDDAVGAYRESQTIMPGKTLGTVNMPFGLMGLGVCYDLRFPEYFRLLQGQGMRVLALPSAFTYVTGKAHWKILLRARAIENQCFVIAANQGGQHNELRRTYGHTCIIDPWGRTLAEQESGEGAVIAKLDLNAQVDLKQKMPVFEHRIF